MEKPKTVIILLIVLVLFLAFQVNAELKVKDYERVKNVLECKAYIEGIGKGFQWANTELHVHGQPRLFCVPENMVLRSQNLIDILERSIESHKKLSLIEVQGRIYPIDDIPIESLLLTGLQETFPCK